MQVKQPATDNPQQTYYTALRSFGSGIKAGRVYKGRRLPRNFETLAILDDHGDSRLINHRHFERAFPTYFTVIAVEARYTWQAIKEKFASYDW